MLLWSLSIGLFNLHVARAAPPPKTIRLGEANVLEEEAPRFVLDLTLAPLLGNGNDTSLTPGVPGVNDSLSRGLDLRTALAYAFDGTWLVGFTINHYQLETTRDVRPYGVDGVRQSLTRDEWGPTLGVQRDGWRASVTYFLSGTMRSSARTRNGAGTTGDVTQKNRRLDGIQVSVGYTFRLTPRFELGPSLVYRDVYYHLQARRDVGTAAETYDYKNLFVASHAAAMTPMLTGLIRF